ncbi:MAG: pyridoxamine 5'-phosphate oxidase family protein [Clostridiales bacterium]|jgi:hypothetical protein|nr:pyridoxamine 5'-phosphate oxidase family protein [Clostridiales bacterium]
MSRYEEGLKLIEERCGNGKDNVISLATIALDDTGSPRPSVRDVNAFYEDGAFYVVTTATSNKMQEIAKNPEVAFAVCFEQFSGNGIGESLGWALDPKNAEIRAKLRKTFEQWYDVANNEQDKNCSYLAIRLTTGTVVNGHAAEAVAYKMDFVNRTA